MLVFRTSLPLKDTVTQEDCLETIFAWIVQSPRYSVGSIPCEPDGCSELAYKKGRLALSVSRRPDDAACFLTQNCGKVTWCTAFTVFQEKGTRYLRIEVSRNSLLSDERPYRVIKPSIIRLLIEQGSCGDDHGIPVADAPLDADAVPCPEPHGYAMPIVFVNCDSLGRHPVNFRYLAAQLGGMAHVFTRKSPEKSGTVEVYYPGEDRSRSYSISNYSDDRAMNRAIIRDIRVALTETSQFP